MSRTVHFPIPVEKKNYWELYPACGKSLGEHDTFDWSPLEVTCESCKRDSRFITALKILSAGQGEN